MHVSSAWRLHASSKHPEMRCLGSAAILFQFFERLLYCLPQYCTNSHSHQCTTGSFFFQILNIQNIYKVQNGGPSHVQEAKGTVINVSL